MDSVTTSDNPTLPEPELPDRGPTTWKQSVADLLGLRLAVGLAQCQGLSALVLASKVHFLGHSLEWPSRGQPAGVANQSVGNRRRTPCSGSTPVASAHAGWRQAPLLLNSPTFGPTIQMSVLTSGSAALKQPSPPTPRTARRRCRPLRQRVPAGPGCRHPGAAPPAPCRAMASRRGRCWIRQTPSTWGRRRGGLPAVCHRNRRRRRPEPVGSGDPRTASPPPLGGTGQAAVQVLALQPLTATGATNHRAARFVAGAHSSLLAPDETSIRPAPSPPRCRPSSAASSQAAAPRSGDRRQPAQAVSRPTNKNAALGAAFYKIGSGGWPVVPVQPAWARPTSRPAR